MVWTTLPFLRKPRRLVGPRRDSNAAVGGLLEEGMRDSTATTQRPGAEIAFVANHLRRLLNAYDVCCTFTRSE
jgi:hypothetical protein